MKQASLRDATAPNGMLPGTHTIAHDAASSLAIEDIVVCFCMENLFFYDSPTTSAKQSGHDITLTQSRNENHEGDSSRGSLNISKTKGKQNTNKTNVLDMHRTCKKFAILLPPPPPPPSSSRYPSAAEGVAEETSCDCISGDAGCFCGSSLSITCATITLLVDGQRHLQQTSVPELVQCC